LAKPIFSKKKRRTPIDFLRSKAAPFITSNLDYLLMLRSRHKNPFFTQSVVYN
jgi:hypothetical protein